jgi:hypothetical protein
MLDGYDDEETRAEVERVRLVCSYCDLPVTWANLVAGEHNHQIDREWELYEGSVEAKMIELRTALERCAQSIETALSASPVWRFMLWLPIFRWPRGGRVE